MLASSGGALTAGGLFRMWLAGNPYVCGGTPDESDAGQLLAECHAASVAEAMSAVSASLRALECISADSPRPAAYDGFGPEWLADIVAGACRACPMGWREAVEEVPLAALTHLALATCRASGVRTGRPMDYSEVDRWLLAANEK